MSTTRKSLTLGHAWTVAAFVVVPIGGIVRRPAAIAVAAAVKKVGALQYANCPKTDPPKPLTQPFVDPAKVIVRALEPARSQSQCFSHVVAPPGPSNLER